MPNLFWEPKSEAEFELGACGCGCHPQFAMRAEGYDLLAGYEDYYLSVWECDHGVWFRHTNPSCVAGPPPFSGIPAIEKMRQQRVQETLGISDQVWLDILEEEERMTPEMRASLEAALRKRFESDEQKVIAFKVKAIEEKWTKKGRLEFRIGAPCRYSTLLLERKCASCGSQVPEGNNRCTRMVLRIPDKDGGLKSVPCTKWEAGQTECGEALTGCWNHEMHGTCIYVHPNERQWADACAKRLPRKLTAQEFADWGTTPPPQNPPQQNRFLAIGGSRRFPPPQQRPQNSAPRQNAWNRQPALGEPRR